MTDTPTPDDTLDDIADHLVAVGIAPPLDSGYPPVDDGLWDQLGADGGRHVPAAVRWFFAHYAGAGFPEGVYYFDQHIDGDTMLGWFLDQNELLETYDDTRGSLPDDVVPISNDGGDNHVTVGVGESNAGTISFHLHDAPLDQNLYALADTFEAFLLSLHRDVSTA